MEKYLLLLMVAFGLFSCNKKVNKPYGMNDFAGPTGLVEAKMLQEIPGGAIIRYKAPGDEDLMYIKIRYRLDSGQTVEQPVSIYTNTTDIRGFGDEEIKEISLIAVDRYENEGKASVVQIKPGKPSYLKVHETITTKPALGGLIVSLQNESRESMTIDVMTTDNTSGWYTAHTQSSHQENIQFSVRGFDSIPRSFRIKVRDEWGNTSKAKEVMLTPLYEKELDRRKFREIILPTDLRVDAYDQQMKNLWNGQTEWGSLNMCHSRNFDNFPQWFTFDLGVKTKLTHYKYWQRLELNTIYKHGSVESWEIWGCAETPKPDGSWEGWLKLLDCKSVKPSGRPVGKPAEEDIEYAKRGEEFEFPEDIPPVRYIRFKVLSTFSGRKIIHIQQLQFWGKE